ncbi:MAG: NRDE family protein [Deltaproteobacteria bacterium]|nr:NRDE family protein [Deltaproteobacteria bacterium]
MCTVFLVRNRVAGWPLVAANNRDEFTARRALPPRVYAASGGRRCLASYDLSGGGSWWGYNNRGLLVFLTNRWVGDEPALAPRSRGELVLAMLARDEVADALAELNGPAGVEFYNPFNLAVLSRQSGFFFSNYPRPQQLPLDDGYHFLGNGALDADETMKAAAAGRLLGGFSGAESLTQVLGCLSRALRTPLPQDSIPPQGFNVRFDGYGTTSSLLLALPATAAGRPLLHYCHGNPLAGHYQDFSSRFLLL